MTTLLQEAINALAKLPPDDQNAIAALILEELADEKCWQDSFANSQDALAELAHQAQQEIQAGRVKDVGIDAL